MLFFYSTDGLILIKFLFHSDQPFCLHLTADMIPLSKFPHELIITLNVSIAHAAWIIKLLFEWNLFPILERKSLEFVNETF